jgi:hypothetical protein
MFAHAEILMGSNHHQWPNQTPRQVNAKESERLTRAAADSNALSGSNGGPKKFEEPYDLSWITAFLARNRLRGEIRFGQARIERTAQIIDFLRAGRQKRRLTAKLLSNRPARRPLCLAAISLYFSARPRPCS